MFPDATEYVDTDGKKMLVYTDPCFDAATSDFVINKAKCADIVAKYKKDNSLFTAAETEADDFKWECKNVVGDDLNGKDACKLVSWENDLWSL